MIKFAMFRRAQAQCALFTVAAAALCVGNASLAAIPGHVTATGTASPAVVKAGGKGTLTVRLTVASGFHINAVKPLESFLVPTQVTAGGLPGVVFGNPVYPVPITITEGTDKVLAYQSTIVVKIPFTVKPGARSGNVLGVVNYQACTTASCFPPTVAKFSTAVTVK
jgi:DsbC/DsbD-like thiol-disulfide interchange protein